jgi:hypothetical protein
MFIAAYAKWPGSFGAASVFRVKTTPNSHATPVSFMPPRWSLAGAW